MSNQFAYVDGKNKNQALSQAHHALLNLASEIRSHRPIAGTIVVRLILTTITLYSSELNNWRVFLGGTASDQCFGLLNSLVVPQTQLNALTLETL